MDIQIGRTVMLQPLSCACQRTKDSVHRHGKQGFVILNFDPGSWRFGNTPAVHLKSVTEFVGDNGKRRSWSGWIPLLEIEGD